MTAAMRAILVIKLGALGDVVHAFHAFAAIRRHHRADHVTLLTTTPFAELARRSPWFDATEIDERAPWWNLPSIRRTLAVIRRADFVYDLQTSARSGRYFLAAGRPPWSGIAPACSHPHADPARDLIHTIERQRGQLQAAGLSCFPVPERGWLSRSGQRHGLAVPYALLVPGGAGIGSAKRWPVDHYAGLARDLAGRGVRPVVIGGRDAGELGRAIRAACPDAVDLTGATSIADVAAIATDAALAVGNDTGPLQLAAAFGAPTIALFSAATSPSQAAPRGPGGEWATVIARPRLAELTLAEVTSLVAQTLGIARLDIA